jgi:hypothetical protein
MAWQGPAHWHRLENHWLFDGCSGKRRQRRRHLHKHVPYLRASLGHRSRAGNARGDPAERMALTMLNVRQRLPGADLKRIEVEVA